MKNGFIWTAVSLISLLNVLEPSTEPLKERLDAIFNGHSYAVWSIQVEDKETGKSLYSMTPHRRLIPASNEKLIVCAAAMLRLGPNYTYNTEFYTTGKIQNSMLQGDLIVAGAGDPSLGGRFYDGDATFLMRQWAEKFKQKGIQTIQGDVIGVDDVFDDDPHGLNWHPSDLIEWYAAEVSALSFNDGCVDIQVLGAPVSGQPANISWNPPTRYVDVQSDVQTVRSAKNERGVIVQREPESTEIQLTGSIRAKGAATVYVTIPNPTLYFATVFKEILQAEGIQVRGSARDGDDIQLPDQKTWEKAFDHPSMPLIQLLDVCMKNSQNLYAEHFLKTLGFAEYGIGSWQTGAMAIKDVFFKHGCAIDALYLADGSGLSRENRISADALVQILRIMDQSSYAGTFFDAMPKAGVNGTLKHRMRGTDAYGRVFAKTGTLNGIRALSGKIEAKSGKTYLFSILGNATRQASLITGMMDEACALIAGEG
ncbi:MAG: D-alanyl-D-alanine carboxypeptidase/D-alanyl-D-alanine-endopeptidase [Candidatus Omnitrophica bacterium]|nr:D-alanyl-D-alanine carboxypeptidase/D-alanyl-D-alanine-endopeptidase [Candidatus Omnitrophota bacterium]